MDIKHIKLNVTKNVGLSLALAGIGGIAAGYALCHFVYKSHASSVTAEAKEGGSDGKLNASTVTAEAKEGDSDGKVSEPFMESMPTTPRGSVNGQSSQNGPGSDLRMSLVVRSDLGLTPGTIGRHCSAAVLGLYKRLHKARFPELRPWELSKCKKMCHTIDSEDAMLELQAAAKREGVPTRIVVDEGMEHNKTVLAMGPAPEQVLLQLLHGLAEL